MKKFFVSLLVFMGALCACLALPACSCSCSGDKTTSATKTDEAVTLTEREITVYIGGKYVFSPKGGENYKYSSSDDTIASVTQGGVLTAKSDGTAFITVSAKNNEVACRVNVIKDENYIRLNVETATAVVGGEVTIKAEVVRNGEITDESVFFGTDYDGMKIKNNGENSVGVTCEETGYYRVTVSRGKLKAECVIKAVSLNAAALGIPDVKVDECKTLKWAAVANATGYEYSVNGGEWIKTDKTEVGIKSVSDGLKYGDNAVFSVKATADNDFDYIDGLAKTIVFAHDYALTELEEYSCAKAGKVRFDCSVCEKSYTDDYIADHEFVDGRCEVCHVQLTPKVIYRYDEVNDCYFVVGTDAGYDSENLYVLAKYDDGKNGERPVKYIGYGAFKSNKTIKRVILPESMTEFVDKNDNYNVVYKNGQRVSLPLRGMVFDDCSNLEFVSMRGVTVLRDIAGYVIVDGDGKLVIESDGTIRIGEPSENDIKAGRKSQAVSFAHWNFRDCYRLTQVIVGDGFTNYGASFMRWINTPDGETRKTDLYVCGDTINGISSESYTLNEVMSPGNNALLTGDIFYYDENSADCFKWHFAADGETIVTGGKHEYNAKGVCKKCGAYNDYGVNYEYDAEYGVYRVGDNVGNLNSDVTVLSEYNDGKNGVKTVAYVAANAFRGNKNLKKIVLPKSVVSLEGGAFWGCANLEYVSMIGVTNLNYASPYGGEGRNNNFRNCFRLKTVITSTALTTDVGQFGAAVSEIKERILDFYVFGDNGAPDLFTGAEDANGLISGNVYYYSATYALNAWHYDDEGNAELW